MNEHLGYDKYECSFESNYRATAFAFKKKYNKVKI